MMMGGQWALMSCQPVSCGKSTHHHQRSKYTPSASQMLVFSGFLTELTPSARCTCTPGWRCPWQSGRRRRWTWTWCRGRRHRPKWTRTWCFWMSFSSQHSDSVLTNGSTWTAVSTWVFSKETEERRQGWQNHNTWGRTYWGGEPGRPRCRWVLPPGQLQWMKKVTQFEWKGLQQRRLRCCIWKNWICQKINLK